MPEPPIKPPENSNQYALNSVLKESTERGYKTFSG